MHPRPTTCKESIRIDQVIHSRTCVCVKLCGKPESFIFSFYGMRSESSTQLLIYFFSILAFYRALIARCFAKHKQIEIGWEIALKLLRFLRGVRDELFIDFFSEHVVECLKDYFKSSLFQCVVALCK